MNIEMICDVEIAIRSSSLSIFRLADGAVFEADYSNSESGGLQISSPSFSRGLDRLEEYTGIARLWHPVIKTMPCSRTFQHLRFEDVK